MRFSRTTLSCLLHGKGYAAYSAFAFTYIFRLRSCSSIGAFLISPLPPMSSKSLLKYMFDRSLVLPQPGSETFFLWGPRQAGKSTLLRGCYPDAYWVDLLKSEVFRRYLDHPEYLRQELAAAAPLAGR